MTKTTLGIIGGSGLYAMEGLTIREEKKLETPFGSPSDSYVIGELNGRPVAFLPRHGKGHRLLPTEINFRANIWGFKSLGIQRILSISAVGSPSNWVGPSVLTAEPALRPRLSSPCRQLPLNRT